MMEIYLGTGRPKAGPPNLPPKAGPPKAGPPNLPPKAGPPNPIPGTPIPMPVIP